MQNTFDQFAGPLTGPGISEEVIEPFPSWAYVLSPQHSTSPRVINAHLLTHDVVVSLIANTATRAGLTIKAKLDTRSYPTGIKVSKDEFEALNLALDRFHGDWNYVITPHASN